MTARERTPSSDRRGRHDAPGDALQNLGVRLPRRERRRMMYSTSASPASDTRITRFRSMPIAIGTIGMRL